VTEIFSTPENSEPEYVSSAAAAAMVTPALDDSQPKALATKTAPFSRCQSSGALTEHVMPRLGALIAGTVQASELSLRDAQGAGLKDSAAAAQRRCLGKLIQIGGPSTGPRIAA